RQGTGRRRHPAGLRPARKTPDHPSLDGLRGSVGPHRSGWPLLRVVPKEILKLDEHFVFGAVKRHVDDVPKLSQLLDHQLKPAIVLDAEPDAAAFTVGDGESGDA